MRPQIEQHRASALRIQGCVLLAIALSTLGGCKLTHSKTPTVHISMVPPASLGGPSEMMPIAGRISDTAPNTEIVLYAHSGVWWLQPLTNQPYTKIQPDLTWKNTTHLGSEYAALLVQSGYHPAAKIVSLPEVGNGVLAVTAVKGRSGNATSTSRVHFSGYDWIVQTGVSDHGGQPYAYDAANVWTDGDANLHLRMANHDGHWSCAELMLDKSLGYGTYIFSTEDSTHLKPSAVMSMFLWDDEQSTNFRNELDMEFSRWGIASGHNAQYVIQPFYAPDNLSRFDVPAGPLTHVFTWQPDGVSFKTVSGPSADNGKTIAQHTFTSDIPPAANEKVHIDLYDFHHKDAANPESEEIVIRKFIFVPATASR
jgi:hypothetical protein